MAYKLLHGRGHLGLYLYIPRYTRAYIAYLKSDVSLSGCFHDSCQTESKLKPKSGSYSQVYQKWSRLRRNPILSRSRPILTATVFSCILEFVLSCAAPESEEAADSPASAWLRPWQTADSMIYNC